MFLLMLKGLATNTIYVLFPLIFPATMTEYDGPLSVVQIYFDTATYDEIERDVKVCQNKYRSLSAIE